MKHAPLLGAIALIAATFACGVDTSDSSQVLAFTAIPDENSTELQQKYDLVAVYLSGKLGVEVVYVPTSSYNASVEAFKNGDVQLAWFGGLTGVQARASVANSRAIAQGTIDPEFKSYFVAHIDAPVEPGQDFPKALKGLSFTFGSQRSTSGRLMPESFIRQATGLSPQEFFGAPNSYAGSHDKVAKLVESGTFQAGVLNYHRYDTLVLEGKLDAESCRVIWTTPTYPDYNWTAHPLLEQRFGPGFIDRLQKALVEIQDPALLSALSRPDGLILATNQDFAVIHQLAAELGFL
jgi:phosphonate transport system substrate-binding protein